MMLRIGWLFGFVSTPDYDRRSRCQPGRTPGSREKTLERSLWEDRLAIVLFMIGAVILTYTLLNAPMPN